MASRGINKVILIGNLGQDPELRYMPNGAAVSNITVATSDVWKDKNTGENKEKTEWHRVVLFGKVAEIAGQYLKKGSQVYIEGNLQTRKWQDQNGIDRYTTEVIVNITGTMQMLGNRNSNNFSNYDSNNFNVSHNKNVESSTENIENKNVSESLDKKLDLVDSTAKIDFEDDLPF